MELDFQNCALVINSELHGDCGPTSLRGMEVVTIAQILIELSAGENTYSVSIGDSQLRQHMTATCRLRGNHGLRDWRQLVDRPPTQLLAVHFLELGRCER